MKDVDYIDKDGKLLTCLAKHPLNPDIVCTRVGRCTVENSYGHYKHMGVTKQILDGNGRLIRLAGIVYWEVTEKREDYE